MQLLRHCHQTVIALHHKMKRFLEQLITLVPYFILIVLLGTLLIFFYKNNITYENFSGIIKILIWPTIVFFAVLFFRRVFTYLFFSMEEFNFFGAKGKLKDIKEVIEERVEMRLKEQKNQEVRLNEIAKFSQELEYVKKSKGDSDKKADEYMELAKDIFSKYKKLSDDHAKSEKELDLLRQERIEQENRRAARMALIRERSRKINEGQVSNITWHSAGQTVKANKATITPQIQKSNE